MTRCEKHGYGYYTFCWFCFCEWRGKPANSGYRIGYDSKLVDKFLEEHPAGCLHG